LELVQEGRITLYSIEACLNESVYIPTETVRSRLRSAVRRHLLRKTYKYRIAHYHLTPKGVRTLDEMHEERGF